MWGVSSKAGADERHGRRERAASGPLVLALVVGLLIGGLAGPALGQAIRWDEFWSYGNRPLPSHLTIPVEWEGCGYGPGNYPLPNAQGHGEVSHTLSPTLPEGLWFTGGTDPMIQGHPTETMPPKTYTMTATDLGGGLPHAGRNGDAGVATESTKFRDYRRGVEVYEEMLSEEAFLGRERPSRSPWHIQMGEAGLRRNGANREEARSLLLCGIGVVVMMTCTQQGRAP